MANGFQGSPKEWERISSPLEKLDSILEKFANEKGLPLAANTKNWPDREFRWTFQIERLIQIYLEDDKELTWTLWACAYQFRNSINMTKKKCLLKGVSIEEMQANLPEKLEEAYELVLGWNSGDLGSN